MFRVCHYNTNPAPDASCPEEFIEDALGYIYDNRGVFQTDVVNISLGLCGAEVPGDIQNNIEDLNSVNIEVILSAGNCTGPSYWDDAADFATLVTAHRPPGVYVSGSSTSAEIHLAAPDSVIADSATTVGDAFRGTSAATPHVAATVLLLREAGFPASTRITRIMSTLKGGGTYLGDGLLDAKAAVKPRPSVSVWNWCNGSSGIETEGDCTFTLTTANGVTPHQAKFIVSRSDVANDSTIYDWGSTTRDIYVGPGDYELTVKAWVRDASPYLRVSAVQSIQQIPVCTEEAFGPACGDS
jgi:hypothetical protein